MNSSQRVPDRSAFIWELAAAIELLARCHPRDLGIPGWVRMAIDDFAHTHGLDDAQSRQLRSEIWRRLKASTRETLKDLARLQPNEEAA